MVRDLECEDDKHDYEVYDEDDSIILYQCKRCGVLKPVDKDDE